MKYIKPQIEIIEADLVLLAASGPGANDIGSPNVLNDAKECSIWDEVKQLNHKEEQDYEDWD